MNPVGDVHFERHQATLVASLTGEIDITNADDVGTRIATAVSDDDTRHVVMDLSSLRFLDSSGIRMVIGLARQVEAGGGAVTLVVPEGSPLWRILDITRMDQIVAIHGSLQAALDGS
jgi:anti-anti-sigma factor